MPGRNDEGTHGLKSQVSVEATVLTCLLSNVQRGAKMVMQDGIDKKEDTSVTATWCCMQNKTKSLAE